MCWSFLAFKGDTCGAFSRMRVCTLSLMLLSYLLWARRSSALRCPAELVFCARDFYERVFIACSFFDSFGSFCPIYSKKVWQITKKCCKMTFLLKENLPIWCKIMHSKNTDFCKIMRFEHKKVMFTIAYINYFSYLCTQFWWFYAEISSFIRRIDAEISNLFRRRTPI